ncbi:GNAT family N-acetyltransferase [Alteribacter lacisalsi]|uniref:GNAT family N-acetyltransferase n=1 Tax=Alteribacter lacisalsi TaxID=2045244 RepID=UPI001374F5DF|nr:GNAT family N-acetyltransferase [Alteribacter lacisalsi]
MEDLRICPVDEGNWRQLIALEPAERQKRFIESNHVSLLESVFDKENSWTCYGLFRGETAVGFMMIGAENSEEGYIWLDRFMIDKNHQAQGLGSAFVQKAIDYITAHFDVSEIVLSVTKENEKAKQFYEKQGFINSGLIDPEYDEEIFTYRM